MVSERNRIVNLVKYLESCGITINIAKNKARGHRGYFKAIGDGFRIDIARGLSEDAVLRTLAHEFAHYVHYNYDKTLQSLDFIFEESEALLEELISITVEIIPKHNVKPLFDLKKKIKDEIAILTEQILSIKPDFNYKKDTTFFENKIKKSSLKYLLKYDNVKVFEGFSFKQYSVETLGSDTAIELFIKLKSKKRALQRANAKINNLNKYYNSPTELFARSFELYIVDKVLLKEVAPNVYNYFDKAIESSDLPLLANFVKNTLY